MFVSGELPDNRFIKVNITEKLNKLTIKIIYLSFW